MCIAVPMRIVSLAAGNTAMAELGGTRHAVDLSLLDDALAGDYVIVHAGYAIEKLDRAEADDRLALFAAMARLERDETDNGPG